jgi:hypothetical protein
VTGPRGVRPGSDRFQPDTLDVFVSRLYGVTREGLGGFIDQHVRPLPIANRVAILRKMLSINRSFSFDLFLPHWCAARLSWRPPYWSAVRRMLARHEAPPPRTDQCAST